MSTPKTWQMVPKEPTEEMVKAYLKANDAYWRRTDEMPPPPNRWRTGRPIEATAESYKAMLAAAPAAPSAEGVGSEPKKFWLWKNFVDGRPEYWAFDNPYPTNLTDGDPQTLGQPCGYALFKPSRDGSHGRTEEQVLREMASVRDSAAPTAPAGGEAPAEPCNKRTADRWLCSRQKGHAGPCDASATDGIRPDGAEASDEAQRKADERMRHDYPLLQQFYGKHALGALSAPSCLCCGQQTHPITRPIAVQHMELPAIVVCKPCKDAPGTPTPAALDAGNTGTDGGEVKHG